MKVSGFTILRQTVRLGYPFTESIRSLLPLVDELVVGVGDGDDGTWEAVQAIGDPKITAFHSPWDSSLRVCGRVLAQQTNLALERCSGEWAVYLQADEVLHEDDLERIRAAMHRHRHRRTEGLLFHYLHFYGSYHTVGDHWRTWYPRAVRAVKTGIGIESVGDACGFRIRRDGYTRGLLKADSGGRVFHYGWCGPPNIILEKEKNLQRFYHDDAWIERHRQTYEPAHIFSRRQGPLRTFTGTHPRVMRQRIAAQDWRFDPQIERQWPSWLRSAGIILAYPFTGGGNGIRPIVPVRLSNSGWIALDLWRKLTGRITKQENHKTV